MPKFTWKPPGEKERPGTDPPSQSQKEPAWGHLISASALQSCETMISVFHHPACCMFYSVPSKPTHTLLLSLYSDAFPLNILKSVPISAASQKCLLNLKKALILKETDVASFLLLLDPLWHVTLLSVCPHPCWTSGQGAHLW